MDTLARVTTPSKIVLPPLLTAVYSKGKALDPEKKYFPSRADVYFQQDWCTRNQTGTHKSLLPFKEG